MLWGKLGQTGEAIRDYTASLAINPTFSNALYNRAVLHFHSRHFREAIADLTNLVESDREDYFANFNLGEKKQSAYYLRALAHERIGHHEDAIRDYCRALYKGGGSANDARSALLRIGAAAIPELERVPETARDNAKEIIAAIKSRAVEPRVGESPQ